MKPVLALVHTVRGVMPLFESLAAEILGDRVDVCHILDEMLLKDLLRERRITPFAHRQFAQHVAEAEAFGASAVLLTCSSMAPCADTAQPMARVPVVRVDEAMVDAALDTGCHVGILATIDIALEPLYELACRKAAARGIPIEIEPVLCAPEAYQAMLAGDTATHDGIVREHLRRLASQVDVVMLAQASMASVLDSREALCAPVLTSPRLAIERLAGTMNV